MINDVHLKPWSCIMFDLDGTITDSAPGILHRLSRTLIQMEHPVPPPEELVRFVGPPILEGFRTLAGMTHEQSLDALLVYRGIAAADGPESDAVVYPGMIGVLRAIHATGVPLVITTSKSEAQANRVLEHLEIHDLFTVITGSSEDETRSAKADVIAEALVRLAALEIDTSRSVLVGDRHHDMDGAFAHGIPAIMVEWGYGAPHEAARAIHIVHSMDQLQDLLV
jgi:phosphoglycolate phosphatase